MKRKPSPWALPAGAAALAATVAAAVGLWPSVTKPPHRVTESARRASASQFVSFEGKIAPAQERLVSAPSGGTIGALDCEAGEKVLEGRLCATIYEKPYQRSLERLETAERNLARDERLLSLQTPGRGARYAQSAKLRRRLLFRTQRERQEIEWLRAVLVEAEKNAKRTEIRAPFDCGRRRALRIVGTKGSPPPRRFSSSQGNLRM